VETTETNYLGTINLYEACRSKANNFIQAIQASTSEVYGMTLQNKDKKLTEDSPLRPNSPYAVSKVAVEYFLKYLKMAYDFPYTILRPYNSYGRVANRFFYIESVITQMLTESEVRLGDPDAVRDWLYVDDHTDGYMKALGNKKAIGETIQLCTGKGYTTKETAELIAKLTKFKGKVIWNSTPRRPLDARILIGDNSKARKLLGWTPKYSLEEGLKKTISYLGSAFK
jgi:dTDP-glucose 4,6-dehydratase